MGRSYGSYGNKRSGSRARLTVSMVLLSLAALVVLAVSVYYTTTVWAPKVDDLAEERQVAYRLVEGNFDAVYYFHLTSLPIKKEFDAKNYPEGLAPCEKEPFESKTAFEDFLSGIFLPKEVGRLMALQYEGKPRYQEVNGELCAAIVQPITDYPRDLSGFSLELQPVTEEEILIKLAIPNLEGNMEELDLVMVNMDGSSTGWRLKGMEV